ncbi:glycine zipper 2TM domain-containing protein [Novosphingobium sp. RD2P27]|uniref:17 kDa surface antigen n=1 Tax=Novosphingobium kalidii TaxID=3230299 RepID=A0ABV2D4X8_9SPHN
MALRFPANYALGMAAGIALMAPGAVLARDSDYQGGWRDGRWQDSPHVEPPRLEARSSYYSPAQEMWLADCRSRISTHDSGVGGAVIGGVAGGVAGNRIAGRGNRTVGTLAGAAVGAAAGAVIDRMEDSGRNRDECEAYLEDYYARAEISGVARGYNQPGFPYGYADHPSWQATYPPGYNAYYPSQPYSGCCAGTSAMMVPAPVQAKPDCTETVEYIYEDVPVTRRVVRQVKRTKVVPDKRVKIIRMK